jgi:hypothetical protein
MLEGSTYLSKRLNKLKVGVPQYDDLSVVAEINGTLKSHVASSPISSNPQMIFENSNIPEYNNANSWGPITIVDDALVVVGEGSIWTIRE